MAVVTQRPDLRSHGLYVFVAMLALLALMAPARAGEDAELAKVFDQFYRIGLDTSRSMAVENLTIERDGLTMVLKSGRLWLAAPLANQITGAYFMGDAVMTVRANGLAGKAMLRATVKGENAGVPFPGSMSSSSILRPAPGEKDFDVLSVKTDQIYFRFSDGFETQFQEQMQEGGSGGTEAAKAFAERSEKLFYMPGPTMENDFLVQLHNDIDTYAFFAAEFPVGSEWILFGDAGSSPEEIWLGTHPGIGGVQQRPFTWASFDRREDYNEKGHWDADLLLDQKPLLDITANVMNIDIPNTLAFSIDARITFTPLADALTVVPFDLINNLGYAWNDSGGRPVTLKSVSTVDGKELPFLHKRDTVLVRLPAPLQPGDSATLRFQADEKTIIQLTQDSWNITSTYPWYPKHGYLGGMSPIDWTVTIKEPYTAIASGSLVETRKEKGQTVTRWVIEREVAFPSFIFGRFQSLEDEYKSELDGRKIALGVHATPTGRMRGTSKSKSVMAEAKVILKLFENLYGPYPFDRLDITQMAPFSGFGQAPPGILFLTGDAFLPQGLVTEIVNQSDRGTRAPYYHAFFAHELGHQWWGHQVLWGRDEDQWLSEAFTEYASALYAYQIDGDARFQEKLKDWEVGAEDGEKSGFPIASANMVTAKDFSVQGKYRTNLIYNKGAFVVHMLRMTIGHEKYLTAMQNFLKNYGGRMATTQMLKHEIELVVGGSMDWFFDQWFYGTGTPSFQLDYSGHKTDDGGYLITGRITQEASGFKQVLMPVCYDLGGKEPSVQNVPVTSAQTEFKAKLPSEPKRVWLDNYNAILGATSVARQ